MGRLILSAILLSLIFIGCVPRANKNSNSNGQSMWTNEQKNNFVSKHARSSIDTIVFERLIDQYQYEKNDSLLKIYIASEDFETLRYAILKTAKIHIDKIAGKTPDEIEQILGLPIKKEIVNPSKIGKSPKYTYIEGIVEIVYINGKSDWITVNNIPNFIDINKKNKYISVDIFSDYTYVKVKTK